MLVETTLLEEIIEQVDGNTIDGGKVRTSLDSVFREEGGWMLKRRFVTESTWLLSGVMEYTATVLLTVVREGPYEITPGIVEHNVPNEESYM